MIDKRNTNAKSPMTPFTIRDFDRQFPDDTACLEWIFTHRYPNGVHCRKCNRVTKHHRLTHRPAYVCDWCGTHVHPTAGTIFHKSPTPLRYWMYAIYLMASTRCGISAKQIQREIGVTYKCAWRMFHQIRKLPADEGAELAGSVEVDETYMGGRGHKRGRPGKNSGKVPVVGLVERGGKVVAEVVPNVKAGTLPPARQERFQD